MSNQNESIQLKTDNLNTGIALIIYNKTHHHESDLNKNDSIIIDIEYLKINLTNLSYQIHLYEDLKSNQIEQLLNTYSKRNYQNDNHFLFFIISSGDSNGILTNDFNLIEYEYILNRFKTNNTLENKPKLFFFNTLNYHNLDENSNLPKSIIENDFLIINYFSNEIQTYASIIDHLNSSLNEYLTKNIFEIILTMNKQLDIMAITGDGLSEKFLTNDDSLSNIKDNNKSDVLIFKKIVYENGDVYEGEFLNELKHGKGSYKWSIGGEKYEGDFKLDQRNGFGCLMYSNNTIYSGNWLDDKMNGKGTLITFDGDKYIGEWKNDQKHGNGKFTWSNGDRYDGEWKNDMKHGYGVFTSSDFGYKYVGYFENDFINGTGVCEFLNGCVYKGDWKMNKKCGNGVFESSNGDTYDGEFLNDEINGKGKCVYANGDFYNGYWKENRRNGDGLFITANGDRYEGEFANNKFMISQWDTYL